MGIMARKDGDRIFIISDRTEGEASRKSAPKMRLSNDYMVWTGDGWSKTQADAMTFGDEDEADEYLRKNFSKLMI